jgi:hypothetical protein
MGGGSNFTFSSSSSSTGGTRGSGGVTKSVKKTTQEM